MKLENKILQTLTQQQKLSLRQQQDLKILEMNASDILSYIEEELEKNPLLQQDDAYENGYIQKCKSNFELLLNYAVQERTLSEEVQVQIDTYAKPIHKDIAYFLADILDSNGYLKVSNEDILNYFPLYQSDDIEETIQLLQTFEPAGICARNLQECLLIQLCFEDVPYSQTAIVIVNYFLQEVAENKLPQIAKELAISLQEVQEAITLIRSLNPKPGSSYANHSMYINPDLFIEVDEDEIHIELFRNNYGLHIEKDCLQQGDKETSTYLKNHLKEAESLLQGIQKRNITLLKIADCIVQHQLQFFLYHQELKPLTMSTIAKELDLHESTISRSISQKSMIFEEATIPLKYFFASSIGEDTSSNQLQQLLKELIHNEDKRKPLSDQALLDILQKEGYQISRRTIAKYRDQLHIPSTSKRKTF